MEDRNVCMVDVISRNVDRFIDCYMGQKFYHKEKSYMDGELGS